MPDIFYPPKSVQNACKRGLQLFEEGLGGDGGSGIVIVRYLTSSMTVDVTGSPVTSTITGGYTVRKFTANGTLTISNPTADATLEYLVCGMWYVVCVCVCLLVCWCVSVLVC